jgi:hypothetical protein
MPVWLRPWAFPLVLVVVVVLFGISGTVATVVAVVLLVICVGGLLRMRVQDLKSHPPDPELARKPFWKF